LSLLISSRRNLNIRNVLCVFFPPERKERGRRRKDSLRAFVYKSAGEWQQGFTVEASEQKAKTIRA
jgi:hypothetical protein